MTGRPFARLLAPIALVSTALALLLILASGGGGRDVASDERDAAAPSQTTSTTESDSSGSDDGSSKKKRRKRYTVQPGDTPSGIAEEVGIPLEELLDLNPEVDPQTLTPGQKLRLR